MITISRELENAFGLSPLYSKEGQGFNATVLAMFVLPGSSACWMATEGLRTAAKKIGNSGLLRLLPHPRMGMGVFLLL